MKKLEISKNEMASVIGGAMKTQGEIECTRFKDKINRFGYMKKMVLSDAKPIAFNGGGSSEGSGYWDSSDWGVCDNAEAQNILSSPLEYLGEEPEELF